MFTHGVCTVYRHSHIAVLQGCRHWSCITDQGSVGCPSYLQARPGLVAGEERVLHHDGGFKVSPVSLLLLGFGARISPLSIASASPVRSTQHPHPPSHQCTLGHKLYTPGELIVRHTWIHWASAYLAHVHLINIFITHYITKQKSSMLCKRQNHEAHFVEYI